MALLLPASAEARINPLRVISERSLNAEVLIVLDTSGSMSWYPSPAYTSGSDCSGARTGTVDFCGDGLCSGNEGSWQNRCSADCPVTANDDSEPGSPPSCNPSAAYPSRMFMVKRVLRNLLPEVNRSASFGLVTFAQTGYFRYYPALAGAARKVTLLLSQTEMAGLGAWDAAAARPRTSFTRLGTTYTLLSGAGLTVDRDSLYARQDDLSVEKRFRWDQAGASLTEGGSTWLYRGSYYTYLQRPASGASHIVVPDYRGPQYTDAGGATWVYHRFNYQYTAQGIVYGSTGLVREALLPGDDQTARDRVFQRIMALLNQAENGGIYAWGGTPTGPAIRTARQHFLERQLGTGTFAGGGADPAAACRPRFVLLLTDGESNEGVAPQTAAGELYNDAALAANPIKTLVVALPGLPSSAMAELDRTADMGDDGKANRSRSAYYANDETSLLKVLKEAFMEMLQGDYTTTPPGVATSGESHMAGDLALVASTSYPGWKGHLRALDLTRDPPVERWAAGELLANRGYATRKLYTGYPDSRSGLPVPLLATDGSVNLAGGCSGCGAVGVRDVWTGAGVTPPADAEIEAAVLWLAGKQRPWKLGPIIRSTPATVGPPPLYKGVLGHDEYRKTMANRERLSYITSNEGLLHAFRVADGSEAFAYVPPNLWPAIHALWKSDGQDPDPAKFRWVLASSPRVEDIPPTSAAGSFSTRLVLTMGPGGKDFVVLDITAPSTCGAASCALNDPPFRVLAHSRDMHLAGLLGETWSVPVMFYRSPVADPTRRIGAMGLGSGYGTGGEGSYHHAFPTLEGAPVSAQQDGSGALVDFAVLADTAAAVDKDDGREVIASYQADLAGGLVRYEDGDPAAGRATVLWGGAQNPLYYSPAVMAGEQGGVLLAVASGSQDEERPPQGAETMLYMLRETGGSLDVGGDSLSCRVSQICGEGSGCPGSVPEGCQAPSSRARPVAPPLLLDNQIEEGSPLQEAFFLLYDPPASVCSAGSSWLVRVANVDGAARLVSSTRYAGVRATGLSMVGGRIDVAVSRIGVKGENATIFTVMNSIQQLAASGRVPYVETWREVR